MVDFHKWHKEQMEDPEYKREYERLQRSNLMHEAVVKRKKRHWKIYREPRDLWIGIYIGKVGETLYICPLPTLVIKTWTVEIGICPVCGSSAHKTALYDGDGWYLGWQCDSDDPCLEDAEVPWPFDGVGASADELETLGFEII